MMLYLVCMQVAAMPPSTLVAATAVAALSAMDEATPDHTAPPESYVGWRISPSTPVAAKPNAARIAMEASIPDRNALPWRCLRATLHGSGTRWPEPSRDLGFPSALLAFPGPPGLPPCSSLRGVLRSCNLQVALDNT